MTELTGSLTQESRCSSSAVNVSLNSDRRLLSFRSFPRATPDAGHVIFNPVELGSTSPTIILLLINSVRCLSSAVVKGSSELVQVSLGKQ